MQVGLFGLKGLGSSLFKGSLQRKNTSSQRASLICLISGPPMVSRPHVKVQHSDPDSWSWSHDNGIRVVVTNRKSTALLWSSWGSSLMRFNYRTPATIQL